MEKTRLLIVEDDRLVLATLDTGLTKAGYAVTTASDGAEALEWLDKNDFDLVVLDIRMPGIPGTEVAAVLAEREIPFLVLTAYGEAELVRTMVERGALGYLVKPVELGQIQPAIEAALERARELRALRETGQHLQHALNGDRNTSKAVGILMERYRLTAEDAFQKLRMHARSRRRKLAEVAHELVDAANTLNDTDLNPTNGQSR